MSQRVLLVEPAAGFAGVHQVRLANAGYTVQLVTTPGATVGAARAFAPDMVILDVDLFESGGIEVARELRAASPAPLLLLVPEGAVAAQAGALPAPHVDTLTKPCGFDDVLAGVRRQLGDDGRRGGSGPYQSL